MDLSDLRCGQVAGFMNTVMKFVFHKMWEISRIEKEL
jgi:hypothetical protein